jgi:hypothetical protein
MKRKWNIKNENKFYIYEYLRVELNTQGPITESSRILNNKKDNDKENNKTTTVMMMIMMVIIIIIQFNSIEFVFIYVQT